MIINNERAINYIRKKVIKSIIGYCCEISNLSYHKYPFTFNSESSKFLVENNLNEISFLIVNFGELIDLENFIDNYFNDDINNHWRTSKDRFKLYINECISLIRDQKLELLNV